MQNFLENKPNPLENKPEPLENKHKSLENKHKQLRILIAGGVFAARRLAYLLSSCGIAKKIYYSLSGATGDKALKTSGTLVSGGFGGMLALVDFIKRNQIDIMIEALHPHAQKMAKNIASATRISGCKHFVLCRGALRLPLKNCQKFSNLTDIIRFLPVNARVFVTLGQSGVLIAKSRKDIFFVLRTIVRKRRTSYSANCHYIYARPAFLPQSEYELMRNYRITHLIARDYITNSSLAKFVAAQKLGVKIFLLQKPKLSQKTFLHDDNYHDKHDGKKVKIFYNPTQIIDYICSHNISV